MRERIWERGEVAQLHIMECTNPGDPEITSIGQPYSGILTVENFNAVGLFSKEELGDTGIIESMHYTQQIETIKDNNCTNLTHSNLKD